MYEERKSNLMVAYDYADDMLNQIWFLIDNGVDSYDSHRSEIADLARAKNEITNKLTELDAEEEDEAMEEVKFSRETETVLARKHRKGDIKAKHHLAKIYPISTDSIRRNGNGAYIHKGNVIRYQYEQTISRKNRREEGKREIREYIPESYEDSTPSYREALERELAALRIESALLTDDLRYQSESENPDWYTIGFINDELYDIGRRIGEINTVLENAEGVWHF